MVVMVSCAVIFISASEVSVVGDRCDLVFRPLVAKNLGLHAVRSGRVCGLVRWLSGVTHSNEFQGDSPYKIGVVGCARSVMVVVLCFAAVLVSRVLVFPVV